MASVDSRLGGLCKNTASLTDRRSLQTEILFDVCDPTSSNYQLNNCDCSSFDNATKTGSISCSRKEPYCLGSMYYGCYNSCLSRSSTRSFKNGELTSWNRCDEFVSKGEVPGTASLCTDSTDYGTCEMKIDGQNCTSCTVVDGPQRYYFDCSNVAEGVKVEPNPNANPNDYELVAWLSYLPTFQACHKPVDGTYCNLCEVGFKMNLQNGTGTVISLNGFGDSFTCSGLYDANQNNQLTSDKCIEATAVAKAECCVEQWYVQ